MELKLSWKEAFVVMLEVEWTSVLKWAQSIKVRDGGERDLWHSMLICIPGSHTMKGSDRAILREEPWWRNTEGNISLDIGPRLACSLAIQLTTLQAASHSCYHVCQKTSDGPEDRSSLDAASSRHTCKASRCAGILSSCRLSHGKPVSSL